jgi:predicted MFS family arabinose efflux permease
LHATFRSLHHRDFRSLWLGLLLSASGSWLQLVGQSLLVLRLSGGSALALGAVSLAQGLAFFIFVLAGGVLADRFEPRRILLVTQSALLGLALVLSLLTVSGLVQVWSVVLLAFLSSAASSFDQPARAALLPRLVPFEDLANAVALQTLAFNTAATLGPTLAGVAVAALGFSSTFLLNAVSFLGVLAALVSMRVPDRAERKGQAPLTPAAFFASSREGVVAVRGSAMLSFALTAYGVMLLVGPSTSFLLPLLATQVLRVGEAQLGVMFSAAGVGAIAGALITASLSETVSKVRFLLLCLAVWSGAMVLSGCSSDSGSCCPFFSSGARRATWSARRPARFCSCTCPTRSGRGS